MHKRSMLDRRSCIRARKAPECGPLAFNRAVLCTAAARSITVYAQSAIAQSSLSR